MKAFMQLFLANMREIYRDKMALFWMLAFPVIFVLIFGAIFSNDTPPTVELGLAVEDQGPEVAQLEATLGQVPVIELTKGDRATLEQQLKDGEIESLLIVPQGASAALSSGGTAPLILRFDPSRESTQINQSVLESVLDGVERQIRPATPVFSLTQETITSSELKATDFFLSGILGMSILNLALFATAQPMISLRVQGVLRRFSATPLPRWTITTSYIAMRLVVAVVQTIILLILGVIVMNLKITGSWLGLVGVLLLGTLAFLAIGFLIAAIAKTEESGAAITSSVQMPMLFLTGVFFPIEVMPRAMQIVSHALPLSYLIDALRQVMFNATPYYPMALNLGMLSIWMVVCTALAVKLFKWE